MGQYLRTGWSVVRAVCMHVVLAGIWLGVLTGVAAAQVDWVVQLTDDGFDPAPAGGTIEHVIKVTNNGFDPAPQTTVDFSVPSGVTVVGQAGTITGCTGLPAAGPATVTCTVPALASLGSADVTLSIETPTDGFFQFSAAVPTAGDADGGNNTNPQATTITEGADIGLSVTAPTTASAGEIITFDFAMTNNGPNTADTFDFVFETPAGLSITAAPGSCAFAGGLYTCPVGPVANGSTTNRVFSAQVTAGGGSDVTLAAAVTNGDPGDPEASNNGVVQTINITGGSDLAIDVSRSPGGSLLVGDQITWTLASSYTGDSPSGITVTDSIPPNYGNIMVSAAAGWSCSVAGQDVQCDRPSGSGSGDGVSLGDILITADVLSAGTPANVADISASSPVDPRSANNSDSDDGVILQDPVVDLDVAKSGPSPALVVVGDDYDFQISARNIGNADFFGTLVLTDTIPAELNVNSIAENGFTCTPAAPQTGPVTITCELVYTQSNPLSPNENTPVVTLNTTVTGNGSFANTVNVSSPDANIADLNTPNDTVSYGVSSTQPNNSADVRVIPSVDLSSLPAGDELTVTFEVINDGPQPSTNVELTNNFLTLINGNIGPNDGYVSETITNGVASGITCGSVSTGSRSRELQCNIATLPVCTQGSDCPTVAVVIRPGGNAGNRSATAFAISQDVPDPTLSNNSEGWSYAVLARADVTVLKSATPGTVEAGQNLTYVVTARNINNGLSRADGVSVTDTLPADLTFVSATPSNGSCSVAPAPGSVTGATSNNTVTCALGNINNGGQRTVTIVVRPNNAVRGTSITNSATVSTTTTETDGSNNAVSVTSNVEDPDLDLLVNKSDTIDPVAIGETMEYVITVTNTGPSASENVVVTDTLPSARLSFQGVTTSAGGSCGTAPSPGTIGGTVECSFAYLPAGAVAEVRIEMLGEVKGSTSDAVTISSDEIVAGFDRIAGNNTTTENTTVRTRTDIAAISMTPSSPVVNLNDDFVFTGVVRVNTGPGLLEADDVVVSNSLPSNMFLTGQPVATVSSGTATSTSCTGSAGGTSFTCDLGTVSSGGEVSIAIPVEVTQVSSLPQTFTNTFSVATSSQDFSTTNDQATGSVEISSSSISGRVFRDFANDGGFGGSDTGMGGIAVQLQGTSFDGRSVSRNFTTAANGTFSFGLIPAGEYQLIRGTVNEPYLDVGILSPGTVAPSTSSGTVSGNDRIVSIDVQPGTAAVDYTFAFVPQARVGIAERLDGAVTVQPDGAFTARLAIVVENFSLEGLTGIDVRNPLAGSSPGLGSYVALSDPANDPLPLGSYTILTPPSGSCGGMQAGFDGSGALLVLQGASLAAGATCTVQFDVRVKPATSTPPTYQSQASVEAVGAQSGQSAPGNAFLADISDDGSNPDPNGNNRAGDAGEGDPTPFAPSYAPQIALVKIADRSGLSPTVVEGDELIYRFEVRNTGNVTLTNVQVADPLPGIVLSGNPIASLAPGATDTATITAIYALTQDDVDAGRVDNQATVMGTDPFGVDQSDLSGATFADDTPLSTPFVDEPSIAVVKTADTSALQSPPRPGDVITYAFEIRNTGNVTLTNIRLADPLPGIMISGGPIVALAPGAVDGGTFTATYAITQDDINAGQVTNQATATGTPPMGPDVGDLSGSAPSLDDPTVSMIAQGPSIALVKIVDESTLLDGAEVGELLNYSFVITNTGNLPLTDVEIADALPGAIVSGGPIAVLPPLAVDDSTITATYAVTQDDILVGDVINEATVTGRFGPAPGDVVTAVSAVTAKVGTISAEPEVFPPFTEDGGVTTSVLASDTLNNAPATLETVVITVLRADDGVTLDPTTGLITMAPGLEAGAYEVEYQIASALVPTLTDTAVETVVQGPLPAIEAVKTQVFIDNGDGIDDIGDRVEYTITVTNAGNMPLAGVTVQDTLTDAAGVPLSLDAPPRFVNASDGSPVGALLPGEVATYRADFTINLQAVNAGGVDNTVLAEARAVYGDDVPEGPAAVSDVSDNGDDTDGNTQDDLTSLVLSTSVPGGGGGLSISNIASSGIVTRGGTVTYTVTVTNSNPFVAGPVTLTDLMPDGFVFVPGSASFDGAGTPVVVTGGLVSLPGVLVPAQGEVVLTVSGRVLTGTPSGTHTNVAHVIDPTSGSVLAGPAMATVEILPEAVFDCGEVIGRVFTDHDGDGYQDPPRNGVIEEGVANVRLATVDGLIITTDANGLFSVPCAALPAEGGANFVLKLDDRSLPAGYRLTTENPRVVRLTPGMLTELNFGVSISRVVRVDVSAAAFASDGAGGAQLHPALIAGIEQMLAQLGDTPSTVRIAFHLPAEANADTVRHARQLMQIVARRIEDRWPAYGSRRLPIERIVVRPGP